MTTEELNTIVQAVIDKINGQVIDFDVAQSTPESTDLLSAVRSQNDGTYQGVTLKWDDVANAVTREAKGYRDDAQTAKTNVENMKASVEQTVNDFNTLAEEKKQEVQGVYQTDLNELKGDLTVSINTAKQELDDKKITKFYASNNGKTNLPDSDSGKPTDMKIFGKSVQDGTPSPSNPIEIQSVVNPVVRMEGKNLAIINNFTNADSYSEIIPVILKKGVRYTCSAKITINTTLRLKLTDGTYQYVANGLGSISEFKTSFVPNMDVVSISFYNTVTVSDLQIEYGSVATEYKRYQEPSSASIPYTLNAIPVESGGNVTIGGQQYIADYVDVERGKLVKMVDSSKLDNTQSIVNKTEWLLAESQEIGLTQEEVQTLKTLATHYPVTNVFVASSQLDGYAIFNYPLNMANGWNYVMQQIGETRPIIYDTQVKTIENLIDTAILTAMMEA